MRITPYNQIDGVTTTPSTENLAYPVTNIVDTYGTQVFKFEGNTDENIVFDAGSGNTIDFNSIGIVNHNFTSSATITIQGNATDSWGSPSFSETVTWVDYLIYQFLSSAASYRYARIRIQDATNTDNLQMGYFTIGTYLQMPGFTSDVKITDKTVGNSYITQSGQMGGAKNFSFRQITVSMEDFSNTQRQAIRTLVQTNGDFTPVLAVLWESDFSKELPLFCRLDGSRDFGQRENQRNNWDTDFTLREVL